MNANVGNVKAEVILDDVFVLFADLANDFAKSLCLHLDISSEKGLFWIGDGVGIHCSVM